MGDLRRLPLEATLCGDADADTSPRASSGCVNRERSVSPEKRRFEPRMSFLICCIRLAAWRRSASDEWPLGAAVDEPVADLLCSWVIGNSVGRGSSVHRRHVG